MFSHFIHTLGSVYWLSGGVCLQCHRHLIAEDNKRRCSLVETQFARDTAVSDLPCTDSSGWDHTRVKRWPFPTTWSTSTIYAIGRVNICVYARAGDQKLDNFFYALSLFVSLCYLKKHEPKSHQRAHINFKFHLVEFISIVRLLACSLNGIHFSINISVCVCIVLVIVCADHEEW